ncbi:MAG: carbonic anhydrase family protein, partial [Vagococcus sp.]
ENVEWYVLKNPVQVSKEQIKKFQEFYDHNNREIQPLNDRVVLEHNE